MSPKIRSHFSASIPGSAAAFSPRPVSASDCVRRGFGNGAAVLELGDELFAVDECPTPPADRALQAVIARNEADLPRGGMGGDQFLDRVVGLFAGRGETDPHAVGDGPSRKVGRSLGRVENDRRPLALGPARWLAR